MYSLYLTPTPYHGVTSTFFATLSRDFLNSKLPLFCWTAIKLSAVMRDEKRVTSLCCTARNGSAKGNAEGVISSSCKMSFKMMKKMRTIIFLILFTTLIETFGHRDGYNDGIYLAVGPQCGRLSGAVADVNAGLLSLREYRTIVAFGVC